MEGLQVDFKNTKYSSKTAFQEHQFPLYYDQLFRKPGHPQSTCHRQQRNRPSDWFVVLGIFRGLVRGVIVWLVPDDQLGEAFLFFLVEDADPLELAGVDLARHEQLDARVVESLKLWALLRDKGLRQKRAEHGLGSKCVVKNNRLVWTWQIT